jgi:predicted phosphodiesterase
MRRKNPPAPELDTTPVLIPEKPLEPILFIPDCHIPNHDEKAWGLLLRVGLALKPKHIVILGDFADGETLSAHPATKPGEQDFSVELEAVKKCLDQLDSLGAENKIYVSGNHEFRLDRYLMEHAPALFRCIAWQNVLGLFERGWAWIPYRKSTKIGKLHLTHDTGSAGVNAHRMSAKAFGGSAIIGHTHRLSVEVTGRFGGAPYLAAMFGWLGDAEKAADYIHEAKASEWVHGFGVGYLEPGNGIVHLQPVPIVNGRCVVNGKLYS